MKTITMSYDEYLDDIEKAKKDVGEQFLLDYQEHFMGAVAQAKLDGAAEPIEYILKAIKSGNINYVFKINHTNTEDLKVVAAAMLGAFVKHNEPLKAVGGDSPVVDVTPVMIKE